MSRESRLVGQTGEEGVAARRKKTNSKRMEENERKREESDKKRRKKKEKSYKLVPQPSRFVGEKEYSFSVLS